MGRAQVALTIEVCAMMITPPGARFSGLAALDVTALRPSSDHAKPARSAHLQLAGRSRPPVGLKRRRRD
jgi:hypothetical protein